MSHAIPHFMASTTSRTQHINSGRDEKDNTYIDPARQYYIDKMNATKKNISPVSFKQTGNKNSGWKKLFSNYEYQCAGPLSNDITSKHLRTVDATGCPQTIHRGTTSLRHRTTPFGNVGAGVPYANQRLSLEKDTEWMGNPYVESSISSSYRRAGSGIEAYERSQAKIRNLHPENFHMGAKPHGELFDKTVRGISRNDTHDPDAQLHSWVSPGRVQHPKSFTACSVAKMPKDHSFLSGHRQFPYKYSEFERTEKAKNWHTLHRALETGLEKAPMRVGCLYYRSATQTDRNPNFHSVQSADESCYHACNDLNKESRRAAVYQQQKQTLRSAGRAATS